MVELTMAELTASLTPREISTLVGRDNDKTVLVDLGRLHEMGLVMRPDRWTYRRTEEGGRHAKW